jgi:hypothetical protein
MSDYRFSTGEHNGIPCLHVLIDCACPDITQTHIPLDDIQAHLRQYNFKAQETIDLAYAVMQRATSVLGATNTSTESDCPGLLASGLEEIIDLCQAQFPRVQTEEKKS